MSRVRTGLTWGVVAAAIALLLLFGWSNRGRFAPRDAGTPAPAYRALSLAGDTVSLEDFRGRVVLLNVWATWCAPCVREMPALERLHRSLSGNGLSVVAVSVDAATPGLGVADVRGFVDELGLTFTVLLDPGGEIERLFRVGGLPMTFLIDREGRVLERIVGAKEWDDPEIAAGIRELLGS
jgi:cytochrome c biogenesis protein CcmG, thiol:disulfide interchange protein DsbE